MLEVYFSDIEGFGREDWENLLDSQTACVYSDWRDWREGGRTEFQVGECDAFRGCPVKEFAVIQDREGERVELGDELAGLLRSIADMGEIDRLLRGRCFPDPEMERDMDDVADLFLDAYERGIARALPLLLSELAAARGCGD